MSYILEALKKAQAERQLGSAPTIHAMPIQPLQNNPAGARRTPLIAGAFVLLAVAGTGAAYWWKREVPLVGVAAVAPVAVAPAPAPVTPAVVPVPMAPAVPVPAPVARPLAVPAPAVAAAPKPAPVAPVARIEPAPAPAPAPAEAPEELYPLLRELPEALQREIPRVAIGGYIYSKNPADRLLLVDKVLRREGEDVGAGQVLEKLQSKAAVMNYRGTRYRIPY